MTRRRARGDRDLILIFGDWPDPRSYSVASIGHAIIKRINERGRDVLLLCDVPRVKPIGPRGVHAMWIPGHRRYERLRAIEERKTFRDFRHLACADRLGLIGPAPDVLARAGVFFYMADRLVPVDGRPDQGGWRYDLIAAYIEARSGRRPVIVRRRPDDIQGGLSRFMRLTGIDLSTLASREAAGILDGRLDLGPIVDNHVSRHRAELKAAGMTVDELGHAIDHVRWVVHQWRLWAREQRELDAVVSQTGRGMRELAGFFGPWAGEGLAFVHNGISFKPECPTRVEALVEDYRRRSGLLVHRGDLPHKERFTFRPGDKVVLFVGRSVPSKGIYELARALRLLHRQSGGRVKGIFVGHFGTGVRKQLAAVDPAGAGDYLLFTGRIWDHDVLASLYAFGDVTALASHVEPFAHTVMESYLMGTPCVVTEGTSAADAYLDEPRRHGVQIALPVARPRRDGIHRYSGVDVDSLARQLHAALFDDGLARRLARDGKAYVQQHYNDRRMGDRYLELFDRLQHAPEPVGGTTTRSRFPETRDER